MCADRVLINFFYIIWSGYVKEKSRKCDINSEMVKLDGLEKGGECLNCCNGLFKGKHCTVVPWATFRQATIY